MPNPHQRIEDVVIVPGGESTGAHTTSTKMRFWNEDGTPFALKGAENKTRLDALEARIAALEGPAEVAEDEADGADGGAKSEGEESQS